MATGLATGGPAPDATAELPAADQHARLARIRARLVVPLPRDVLWGWLGPLLVTGLAAYLRFHRLGVPQAKVFDEVYYSHDAWSLLHHGVELNAHDNGPGFVVHPPLGKWMMAFGEWIFGTTAQCVGKNTDTPFHYAGSFGWRFSSAVVGTLAVLIIADRKSVV